MPGISEFGHITATAAVVLTPIWSFLSSFLILLVLMALLALYAKYMGNGPFISLLAAFYIGYAFYAAFPYRSFLPTSPPLDALIAAGCIYFAFVILSYAILRRVAASDFISIGWIGLFILSLLGAGFILALAYDVFPVREIYAFTPALDTLFAAKQYFFWWFAGPLIGLFYLAVTR